MDEKDQKEQEQITDPKVEEVVPESTKVTDSIKKSSKKNNEKVEEIVVEQTENIEEQPQYFLETYLDLKFIHPDQRLFYRKRFGKVHKKQTIEEWDQEISSSF